MLDAGVQVQLVEVCAAAGVPIIADEVYQQNVWADDKAFVSFRKVALDHPQPAGTVVRPHHLHLAVCYVRMLRVSSRAGRRRLHARVSLVSQRLLMSAPCACMPSNFAPPGIKMRVCSIDACMP